MYTSILKSILAFAGLGATLACDDHASHAHTRRTVPVRPPTRELEWGDINFIHTTDTHGWYLGHQKSSAPEPNYRSVPFALAVRSGSQPDMCSGDMGEFLSFAQRMKEKALVSTDCIRASIYLTTMLALQKKDVDLLVIDSGDLHSGLSPEVCVTFVAETSTFIVQVLV